ncbi:MAG TPA: response regulator transcription factor [Terriglobia bacterium]|nr:response regulator transcription factor [Terriglobia bacterium]
MKTIRILIADDHSMIRRGLKLLLESQKKWHICGEAGTGAEAVEQVKALKPDIVIMDISMPGMNGLEALQEIRNVDPQIGVLMLTMHDSKQMLQGAMQAGARGYVLKSDSETNLFQALEAVWDRKAFFSPGVSKTVLENYIQSSSKQGSSQRFEEPGGLTPRQLAVLKLLVRGMSNKQVAGTLGISARTVESHRYQIMNRLNVRSLSELVLYAVRNRILEP